MNTSNPAGGDAAVKASPDSLADHATLFARRSLSRIPSRYPEGPLLVECSHTESLSPKSWRITARRLRDSLMVGLISSDRVYQLDYCMSCLNSRPLAYFPIVVAITLAIAQAQYQSAVRNRRGICPTIQGHWGSSEAQLPCRLVDGSGRADRSLPSSNVTML